MANMNECWVRLMHYVHAPWAQFSQLLVYSDNTLVAVRRDEAQVKIEDGTTKRCRYFFVPKGFVYDYALDAFVHERQGSGGSTIRAQ